MSIQGLNCEHCNFCCVNVRKILKLLALLTGIVLLLLWGGNLLLHYWLNKQLPRILNGSENRHYDIRYGNFSINWMNRRLVINHITIRPYHATKDISQDTSTGVNARIDRFLIQDVSLRKLFLSREISTRLLRIQHPELELTVLPGEKLVKDSLQANIFLSDVLKRIRVNNIELQDASLRILDKRKKEPLLEFGPFELSLLNVVVDTATLASPFPFRYGGVELDGQTVVYRFSPFYTLQIPHLSLKNKTLQLDSVVLQPVYSKDDMQRQIRYQQDWYHLTVSRLGAQDVDWGFMAGRLFIRLKSLDIDTADFHIYRDKRKPFPPFKKKPLLGSFLRNLPFLLTVDSLKTSGTNITYEEHPDGPGPSGNVVFDRVSCRISHISNDTAVLQKYPVCEVEARSSFLGASPLHAHFRFFLDDLKDRFTVKASLGSLRTSTLNKVLSPLAGMTASGQIHQLDFTIEGDDISAGNTMRFLYDSLQLSVFEKETRQRSWLLSGVANLFLHHRNMPGDKGGQQITYRFTRYQNRSYFNYLWNCIKTGALNTLLNTKHSKFKKKQLKKFLQRAEEKKTSNKK